MCNTFLKKGAKARVKMFNKRPSHWNSDGEMDKFMGEVVTIAAVSPGSHSRRSVRIEGEHWNFYADEFEPPLNFEDPNLKFMYKRLKG